MAAPTLEQNIALRQALRSDITDYGNPGSHLHKPQTPRTIRLPSGDSFREPSPAGAGFPGLPRYRPRVFNMYSQVQQGGDVSVAVATPLIVGPALIDWVMLSGVSAEDSFVRILKSADNNVPSGGQAGVLTTSGEALVEYAPNTGGGLVVQGAGAIPWMPPASSAAVGQHLMPLGIIVPDESFYLKLVWRNIAAGTGIARALVRVVENIDPDCCPGSG